MSQSSDITIIPPFKFYDDVSIPFVDVSDQETFLQNIANPLIVLAIKKIYPGANVSINAEGNIDVNGVEFSTKFNLCKEDCGPNAFNGPFGGCICKDGFSKESGVCVPIEDVITFIPYKWKTVQYREERVYLEDGTFTMPETLAFSDLPNPYTRFVEGDYVVRHVSKANGDPVSSGLYSGTPPNKFGKDNGLPHGFWDSVDATPRRTTWNAYFHYQIPQTSEPPVYDINPPERCPFNGFTTDEIASQRANFQLLYSLWVAECVGITVRYLAETNRASEYQDKIGFSCEEEQILGVDNPFYSPLCVEPEVPTYPPAPTFPPPITCS